MQRLLALLDEEVNARIEGHITYLVTGRCSHDEYIALCAEIKGLRYGYDYMKSLSDKMENDDE